MAWCCALLLAAGSLLPATRAEAARETLRFEIEGQSRSVLVFVPDDRRAPPRPLVVVFHGKGDDSVPFATAVKLHKDWPEAIVAYPRGVTPPSSKMRGWQYRRGQYRDRDLQLTDQLLEELAERYGTRPESTYVAGFSNGGHFVFLLLAERPDAFAAFAAIGAVQPEYANDSAPRPLLYLFGRGEDRIYQDDWIKTVEALTRHNRTRGALADFLSCCKMHSPGPGGAPLVFGTYNAGHIWPAQGNEWLIEFFTLPWALQNRGPVQGTE